LPPGLSVLERMVHQMVVAISNIARNSGARWGTDAAYSKLATPHHQQSARLSATIRGQGNLDRALSEEPRPGAERKLTGKEEALLVATACAKPPEGRARWTLGPGAMVKLTEHKSLSHETVRRR
jgi:hypothetical protein